jgi:hypothetical protein
MDAELFVLIKYIIDIGVPIPDRAQFVQRAERCTAFLLELDHRR